MGGAGLERQRYVQIVSARPDSDQGDLMYEDLFRLGETQDTRELDRLAGGVGALVGAQLYVGVSKYTLDYPLVEES